MQLTESRNTPRREGDQVAHPVAASTLILIGGLVALDADGFLVPATAAGGKVVGVAETHADNRDGVDGDQSTNVRRSVFAFNNSATSAITRKDIGAPAYVEDDNTVAKAGTAVAGVIIDLGDEGVWVDVGRYAITVTAAA
ncbi:MAG: hypothetical protein WBW32_05965 [Luteibacter sp.]